MTGMTREYARLDSAYQELLERVIELQAENKRLKQDHHSACVRNDTFVLEIERLNAECDQYQDKLTEVWVEVGTLRRAAEKLQAYVDSHPCDHGPPCRG